MQLWLCWLHTARLLVYATLILTVLALLFEAEAASNFAKNKPPAMAQVAYLADGWNAGLFNFFTETLSLFKRWAFFVDLLHRDNGHNDEYDVDKACRADDVNHEKSNKFNSD